MMEEKIIKNYSYDQRQTKSTAFILPMLEKPYYSYGNNFLNCYIGDKSDLKYTEKIILLFKFSGTIEFCNFENQLREIPSYFIDYSPVRGYTCFAYHIPDKYYIDFTKFIKGKYSMFSEELRQRIIGGNSTGTNAKIFNKDAQLRKHWEDKIGCILDKDAEVYPVPNLDEEILDYDKHFKVGL